jgi:hypothetical protein
MVSPAGAIDHASPAIPVPDGEKLKSEIYQLFAKFRQRGEQHRTTANNAGAAVSAGWFTNC